MEPPSFTDSCTGCTDLIVGPLALTGSWYSTTDEQSCFAALSGSRRGRHWRWRRAGVRVLAGSAWRFNPLTNRVTHCCFGPRKEQTWNQLEAGGGRSQNVVVCQTNSHVSPVSTHVCVCGHVHTQIHKQKCISEIIVMNYTGEVSQHDQIFIKCQHCFIFLKPYLMCLTQIKQNWRQFWFLDSYTCSDKIYFTFVKHLSSSSEKKHLDWIKMNTCDEDNCTAITLVMKPLMPKNLIINYHATSQTNMQMKW